jgi:hypothetical protein
MEAYIETYRTSFLPWRGGAYGKNGLEYCLGSKQDTSRFIEDGAISLPWGAKLDESKLQSIKALRLVPNRKQTESGTFPAYLKDMVALEFLSMPLAFVMDLSQSSLPDSLTSLMLINSGDCLEYFKKKKFCWPSIVFPKLRAMQFFDFGGAPKLDALVGLSGHALPSLNFFEYSINKSERELETIAEFSGLEFLALELVSNYDIFKYINSPLKALSIVGSGSKFPFGNIADLNSLEFIWMNNIKCEIDCEIFKSLPNLIEINVVNTTKITNIEALLSCNSLKSIQFVRCGKPFKKHIKPLFVEKKYDRLRIDFS